MAENSSSREDWPWQLVGSYRELNRKQCRHVYAEKGKKWDLALAYIGNQFHAVEAWCGHMGGPLAQGDIEDYNGSPHIMCPWHGYMFDLKSGNNDIGLQMAVYDVKYEDSSVYIKYHSKLSLNPYASVPRRKNTVTDPPQDIPQK